ncbi:MAG: bifunctional DNA-formamidopyrimidine glycosylase/DNA-(apurinic or apyrimidinic site) lyase [Steroidobacteraceae bacterium]
MPELPEVETTRRGVEPHVVGRRIVELALHERRLRWPVPPALPAKVAGRRVTAVERRAKYLLFRLDDGATLMLHLGMSGSLRVLPAGTPRKPHDHFDLQLDSGETLRFNDPRRFGSLHRIAGEAQRHPLLRSLGPEPFDAAFDTDYLWRATRGRPGALKKLVKNSRIVVGVGNIYASEALFRARVRPRRRAGSLKRAEVAKLVKAIRAVLAMAVRVGGTTLRDYVGVDGNPGYFRQKLYVYERGGEPCRVCGAPIRQAVQGQRSTYWCAQCQR